MLQALFIHDKTIKTINLNLKKLIKSRKYEMAHDATTRKSVVFH